MLTGCKKSVVLSNVKDIKKIKALNRPDIQVWGSSKLVQLLLEHGLANELKLKIHPLTLSKGKKLFANAAIPAAYLSIEYCYTQGSYHG